MLIIFRTLFKQISPKFLWKQHEDFGIQSDSSGFNLEIKIAVNKQQQAT